MKYCLRSRLPARFLRQADEIKVDFRDRATIPDLAHTYPDKTLILFPPTDDSTYDWNEITRFDHLANHNLVLNCANIPVANKAKELGLRFFLALEAQSYWDLEGMIKLGAEYAYVGIPLFFDLEHSLDFDIKLRAIPTVAYNHTLPHSDGVCGQWIRPEDVNNYEGYIEVFEFEPCSVQREQTLFKTYALDKHWSTRLDLLVEDLGSPAINRMIPPDLAERRINCRQRCMSGGACHLCWTYFKLANSDLFPEQIKEIEISIDNK